MSVSHPVIPAPARHRRVFTRADEEVWAEARRALDGLPGGGLNMAYEAVDRHVEAGCGGHTALRWIHPDGRREDVSYGQLAELSARAAGGFESLGMTRGQRVALLLPRRPELHAATLGALKAGLVGCPLFSAFAPEPVTEHLRLGEVTTLVATPALYEQRVRATPPALPALRHIVLVGDGEIGDETGDADVIRWNDLLARGSAAYAIPATAPEEPALLHFTSGTTGAPKGAVHVHAAVIAHHMTAVRALGLRPTDTFWCTADPGCVTGMSYGAIAPLTCGATVIVDEGEFDAERWYNVLEQERVNVWYTSPTAIRQLMRFGGQPALTRDLSELRHVASVGEPLDSTAVLWGTQALGQPIHDTWWQTETGAIMVANVPGEAVRAGSMGRPIPGIRVAVLAQGPDGRAAVDSGHVHVMKEPEQVGELAVRVPWPSMFQAYIGDPLRYAQAFADGWYLTGDLARVDRDGWLWFVSRADDLIKSAGHLIGPFEVESVLKAHSAVADAGVFGLPDPVAGEIVTARIVLRPGIPPDEATRRSIMADARLRLGAAVAPRGIGFVDALPFTQSGKVLRRLLRAQASRRPAGELTAREGRS